MSDYPLIIKIRPAHRDDAQAIQIIYAPFVADTAITFEYEVPSITELTHRIITTQKNYPYLVAEINNQVVGYAYAGSFNSRPAYNYVCELSIYVSQQAVAKGIGQALYQEIERLLMAQDIVHIISIISLPNEPSLNFHYKNGFIQIGHFPKAGFKKAEWHDIVWLLKTIQTPF